MGTKPIVRHLQVFLPTRFPVLLENARRWGTHPSGVGGYSSSGNHSTGRAADIFLDAHDPQQRPIGDALFRMFIDWHEELGVDYVMWNQQIWSRQRPTIRRQTWDTETPVTRHENHLHVQHLASRENSQPAILISLLDDVRSQLAGAPGFDEMIANLARGGR